jgi:hypothetical protein
MFQAWQQLSSRTWGTRRHVHVQQPLRSNHNGTRRPRWSAGIRREMSDRSPATRCGYASRRPARRSSRSARPSSSVGPVDSCHKNLSAKRPVGVERRRLGLTLHPSNKILALPTPSSPAFLSNPSMILRKDFHSSAIPTDPLGVTPGIS